MKRSCIYIHIIIIMSARPLYPQGPQYSQYMFNNFAINPAVAGTNYYYQIKSTTRIQWASFTDAPKTYSLSVYGPHQSKDMGFGGQLYSDVTGPTSRLGISMAYAYNIGITEDMRISGGINVGAIQYKVDGSKLSFLDESDLLATGEINKTFVPDASIGLYLYSSYYQFGFSAHQLLGNKLNLFDEKIGINKLKQHFYITGGTKLVLNKDFELEPSVLIKGVSPYPLQFELNVNTTYQKLVWGGISFRTKDAVSILLGYIHNNKFYFGYSYDATLNNIRKYSSGSHELMLGVKFNAIK